MVGRFALRLFQQECLLFDTLGGARKRAQREGLIAKGAAKVLVTDGGKSAAFATPSGVIDATPPQVLVTRVTGAGDTFMAAHIAAETRSDAPQDALEHALSAAAAYVSGDVPS